MVGSGKQTKGNLFYLDHSEFLYFIPKVEESSDNDLEVVEALLARKYSKGRGKYKGKAPLICFSCKEVCHIATRCPK